MTHSEYRKQRTGLPRRLPPRATAFGKRGFRLRLGLSPCACRLSPRFARALIPPDGWPPRNDRAGATPPVCHCEAAERSEATAAIRSPAIPVPCTLYPVPCSLWAPASSVSAHIPYCLLPAVYFTTTFTLAFLPFSAFTVMVTVPFFSAFTTPFVLTFATVMSLLFQV